MRILISLFCVIALFGQETGIEDPKQRAEELEQSAIRLAQQWIRDPGAIPRAWAADMLQRYGDIRLVQGDLTEALGSPEQLRKLEPSTGEIQSLTPEDKMRLAILDTLIVRQAVVPARICALLFRRYPAQALILLVRAHDADATTWTQIMQSADSDAVWLVAADALAARDGGPVKLLDKMHMKGRVVVFDDRALPHGGTAGGVLGGLVGQIPASPDPWPALHTYTLALDQKWRGSQGVLYRSNMHIVEYDRIPGHHIWLQSESRFHGDRDVYTFEVLADCLARMQGMDPPLSGLGSVRLKWSGADQYRSDLWAFVAELRRRHFELLYGLARMGRLSDAERARCPFELDIDVIDDRSNSALAIPLIGLGDHVRRIN